MLPKSMFTVPVNCLDKKPFFASAKCSRLSSETSNAICCHLWRLLDGQGDCSVTGTERVQTKLIPTVLFISKH